MRSGLRYLGVKATRRIDMIDTHTREPVTAVPILAPFWRGKQTRGSDWPHGMHQMQYAHAEPGDR
jgi:hypothetical protein